MDEGEALENILNGVEFSIVSNSTENRPQMKITYSSIMHETCKDMLYNNSFRTCFQKSSKAAHNYGYIGKSKGKRNGIVDIRKEDKTLLQDYKAIMKKFNVQGRYNLSESITPVKIVAHIPTGDRFVGCKDNPTRSIVIFGMSNYKKRYF